MSPRGRNIADKGAEGCPVQAYLKNLDAFQAPFKLHSDHGARSTASKIVIDRITPTRVSIPVPEKLRQRQSRQTTNPEKTKEAELARSMLGLLEKVQMLLGKKEQMKRR